MKKYYFLVLSILIPLISFSNNTEMNPVEMADGMRSDGKIYVVISCIGLIFIGLFIHLLSIENRLRKIEKEKSK